MDNVVAVIAIVGAMCFLFLVAEGINKAAKSKQAKEAGRSVMAGLIGFASVWHK